MARSVVYKFNFNELVNTLVAKLKIDSTQKLQKILLSCGEKLGEYYVILSNEYKEDYDPFFVVCRLIDRAFNITDELDDSLEVLLDLGESMINYADKEELIQKLKL